MCEPEAIDPEYAAVEEEKRGIIESLGKNILTNVETHGWR